MRFLLNDEQESLFDTVTRFAQERVAPRLRTVIEGNSDDVPDLWAGMMDLGLGGIVLPEEFGGVGLGLVEAALVAEALGYHAAPGPFLGHTLCGLAIALAGSEEQKRCWLPKLATGEAVGTIALAEPGTGWLPEQWTLESGNHSLANHRLEGGKTYVPDADRADIMVVGLAGGGLGLVETGGTISATPLDGADLTRRLWSVRLTQTPFEPLTAAAAGAVLDAGLVLLAADAFGGARRCVNMAVDYVKTREQFGGPIGRFQALKHQLVGMAVETEPCRGLYWYAAYSNATGGADAARMAALAKAHITDRFLQVARDTVEAHGGIGYTWECDVQIWFKRAMFDYAMLGNPQLHWRRSADLAGW